MSDKILSNVKCILDWLEAQLQLSEKSLALYKSIIDSSDDFLVKERYRTLVEVETQKISMLKQSTQYIKDMFPDIRFITLPIAKNVIKLEEVVNSD